MPLQPIRLIIFGLIICLATSCLQNNNQASTLTLNSSISNSTGMSTGDESQACDTSIWKYVYNPGRLQVIKKCITVRGVIEESNADDDGDQHMLLKLDKGQKHLLTDRNMKKKQGDLVIEAVCINNIARKKVGNTCNGYVNKVKIPAVGDHVSVTGTYVIDTHNGWSEIHPITSVNLIK